jgi:hypothetical protein
MVEHIPIESCQDYHSSDAGKIAGERLIFLVKAGWEKERLDPICLIDKIFMNRCDILNHVTRQA